MTFSEDGTYQAVQTIDGAKVSGTWVSLDPNAHKIQLSPETISLDTYTYIAGVSGINSYSLSLESGESVSYERE